MYATCLFLLRYIPHYSETEGDFYARATSDGSHAIIEYENSSIPGQSGGPCFLDNELVGIHVSHKRGTLIVDPLLEWISEVTFT